MNHCIPFATVALCAAATTASAALLPADGSYVPLSGTTVAA